MHNVGIGAGIGYIDRHGHTLAQAQQRTGNLAVVGQRLDGNAGSNFQGAGFDAQTVVSFACRPVLRGQHSAQGLTRKQGSSRGEKVAAVEGGWRVVQFEFPGSLFRCVWCWP